MNLRDVKKQEMIIRADDFGDAHAMFFPPDSLGGRLFRKVKDAREALHRWAASQESGQGAADQGTVTKEVAQETLRAFLRMMSATARAIAVDTPGVEEKFRAPRTGSYQRLLNGARAFLTDATPLADLFISHGMPADFLEQLQQAMKQLQDAIHDHSFGKDSRIAARTGLEVVIETAFSALRKLDAIVPNTLHDPDVIAFWRAARHIDRVPRRNGGAAPAPSPAPAALVAASIV